MILRFALVLGLLLGCIGPAWAAPAYVRTGPCGAGPGHVFAGAPTNNNAVAGAAFGASTFVGVTLKDSNNVSLAQEANFTGGATSIFTGLWDYIVVGSPTATYTASVSATMCIYEMSGVAYPGVYCNASAAANAGTTISCTLAGVAAGDLLIYSYRDLTNTPTVTASNATATWDSGGPGNGFGIGHSTATATTSTTLTLTVTAGDNVALAMADYAAGGGGGGSTTTGPRPWLGAFLTAPDWRRLCV